MKTTFVFTTVFCVVYAISFFCICLFANQS
jgi:hypothetical protein